MKNSILRIAIMFAWIPLAFLIGWAAHSRDVFVVLRESSLSVGALDPTRIKVRTGLGSKAH